ncbi:MAG: hypothetical protein NC417_11935 [Candidatus Gastranaerophilales bacterium]|nr:hypothetical protein [Candidatus Gastranaerophilales bacterium]
MTEVQEKEATRSLKLRLYDKTADEVKAAADKVLDSVRIFAASLCRSEQGWTMVYGDAKISECIMFAARSQDWAEGYMGVSDRLPMDMEQQLYQAEVIPIVDGGAYLYVRFHKILLDERQMEQIAQKFLDAMDDAETF